MIDHIPVVPVLFAAAGLCGIIPPAGPAAWPLVAVAGIVWALIGLA